MEFMQWMGENGVPFVIIFTKADKLKEKDLKKNISQYQEEMLEIWEEMPQYFLTSATSGLGQDDVLDYIENLNGMIHSQNAG